MPENSQIRPPSGECELDQFARILALVFSFPEEQARQFVGCVTHDGIRILCDGGEVAGGMCLFEIGQWFGGRCVPMAGISGVGVSPQYRGAGVAARLMRSALSEARERGMAISTLYPASIALYRKFGYERAGSTFLTEIPTRALPIKTRELQVARIAESDHDEVDGLYNAWAGEHDGNISRNPATWRLVRERKGKQADGFKVVDGGAMLGYRYLVHDRSGAYAHQKILRITDLAWRTPAAADRLITLLADHRSMVRDVLLYTGPADPLLVNLPEIDYSQTHHLDWMLRILDVTRALEARGYPEGVEAELHLDIRDSLFDANTGRYVVSVADGRGSVRAGGDGTLAMDERTLAAMYTGHVSPAWLRSMGRLAADTDPDQLARAATVLASPAPWMRDQF